MGLNNYCTDLNNIPVDAEFDQEAEKKEQELELESENFELRMNTRRDERFLAFYLVYAVDRFDYTISTIDALKQFRAGFDIDVSEDSFSVKMAQGTVEKRDELDEQIKPYLKNWKLERLGICTKLILRLALFEISQEGSVSSIVINEAVELAKAFAEKDAYKFVNGILDEICKINEPTEEQEIN
jgi:N utilization substance protein B